jgi:ABC-2 type transport system ATP-binding protein
MVPPTVEIRSVSRRFGDVTALSRLTLDVPAGTITVLLGPNGAGKTTAIRVITGALQPDEGTVRVFGSDPVLDGTAIRQRCGVVTAKPSLYDRLSGLDNLRYAAELYDLGRGRTADERARAAAARFGIADALPHEVGGYSTGMKTRLALARAVLHDPDLLLLDEPTSGLDPESAAAVLDLIRSMATDGKTVLMCTHLLLEAEGLADRVVILQDGTSLVAGPPAELARRYWPAATVRISAEDGRHLDALPAQPGVRRYERQGDTATIELDRVDRTPDLVRALSIAGVRLTRVEPFAPTLEDLYFAVRRDRRSEPRGAASPPGAPEPIPAPAAPTRRPTRRRPVEELAR